jgi:hypothetical protein
MRCKVANWRETVMWALVYMVLMFGRPRRYFFAKSGYLRSRTAFAANENVPQPASRRKLRATGAGRVGFIWCRQEVVMKLTSVKSMLVKGVTVGLLAGAVALAAPAKANAEVVVGVGFGPHYAYGYGPGYYGRGYYGPGYYDRWHHPVPVYRYYAPRRRW